jgi:hypothetical protein
MEVSGQLHAPHALSTGRGPPLPIGWEVKRVSDPVVVIQGNKRLLRQPGFTLICQNI